MTPTFALRLRAELQARGVLGDEPARAACVVRVATLGDAAFAEVERIAGAATVRRALAVRRPDGSAETYRYVLGYGELTADFAAAPVRLSSEARPRIARLGALANLIVGYFDEMVDSGWPRSLLLPGWALALATSRVGRAALRAGVAIAPAPTRLVVGLVTEYFERIAALPHAAHWAPVRRDLINAIMLMYDAEGRTPRELRRLRGDAARQKKTPFPLVVLGLPAWLASPACEPARYARHRRWLHQLGKFIRWIDDAADFAFDQSTGASNLVRRALAHRDADAEAALARRIAQRGQWLQVEWRQMVSDGGAAPACDESVLATAIVAWLDEPVHH